MKKCIECNIEKPLSEFHNNRNRKDGLNIRCKPCYNKYNNESQKRHRIKNKKKNKEYNMGSQDESTFLSLRPFNFNRDYSETLDFLQKIGYDTTQDIHEQFLKRVLMKSGVILKKKDRPKDPLTKYFT